MKYPAVAEAEAWTIPKNPHFDLALAGFLLPEIHTNASSPTNPSYAQPEARNSGNKNQCVTTRYLFILAHW